MATRRSTMIRRYEGGIGASVVLWLRRALVCCAVLLFLAIGAVWLILGDAVIQRRIDEKFQSATADMGYKVANILVEGRVNTDGAKVLEIVGVQKGDPLFAVDPAAIKDELDQISWVKAAHVERRLPDTVYVRLEERMPFALWQRQDRSLVLIDQEGVVLSDKNLKSFEHLIMIKGKGAPESVLDLARMLEAEPQIKSRLDHAVRIEGRRWDLVLKGDRVVKLPEKDLGLALRNLALQQEKEGLLDKSFTSLDVRDGARLTLRTEVGRARDLVVNVAQAGQSL